MRINLSPSWTARTSVQLRGHFVIRGHGADVEVERGPEATALRASFDLPPEADLPPALTEISEIAVGRIVFPVVPDPAERRLAGRVEAPIAGALFADPPPPPPTPASPPPAPPPPGASPVAAKYEAWQGAKSALVETQNTVRQLERRLRTLRAEAEEVTEDLEEARASLPVRKAAAADLRQQLLDALGAEEE